MVHRVALTSAIAAITSLAAQLPARPGVPRLWTDAALAGWSLPIAEAAHEAAAVVHWPARDHFLQFLRA